MLVVDNVSRRRILHVTCRVEPAERAPLPWPRSALASSRTLGKPQPHRGMICTDPAEGSTVPLILASSQYGFLFKFDLEEEPGHPPRGPVHR